MKIEGAVAFVTGANRGLGLAVCKGLLGAGASKVYAASRIAEASSVPGLFPIQLDITRQDQLMEAARQCADTTLLINNAGIARPSPFASATSSDFIREQFETNFFGTLAVSRAFAPILAANGGGTLVNILSALAWVNMNAINGYCASKAAAWSLTNGLRNELRPSNTLVVGVHAAFIDTDMARHVNAPKVSPAAVVDQLLTAIESGKEEVFADTITRNLKKGLSVEHAPYLDEAGR